MHPVDTLRPLAALACAALIAACTTAAPPAAQPATGAGQAVPDFVATGNEPFWSVRVAGDTLVFSTPEDIEGQVLAPARRFGEAGLLRYEGEAAGSPFVLVLHEEPCQDSMSGWHHDFRSEFTWAGRVLAGCARRGSDPVGELPPGEG